MKHVILSPLVHRQMNCIKIKFDLDNELQIAVKSLGNCRWSQTHKAWYVENKNNILSDVFVCFKGKALVNYEALANHKPIPLKVEPKPANKNKVILHELNESQAQKIAVFKKWLVSRRYAGSTILTYIDALKIFIRYYGQTPIEELDNQSLIDFNNNYIMANKFSASFQNQIVNAIKLFFSTVENKKMQPELIHRPKRAKHLPNVLSKQEVKQILGALSNVKHKAMLGLIYSCGLRRSELLNLKLNNIDSKRNLLIIKQSKGRRDRLVPLSEKTLELLRSYYDAYKPKEWLFEGQDKTNKYDESSLASVLKQALEKCRISKPVTLHWLRHSYATHLLENGTDLRYIQEILGHSRSTTTEIYTHVSNLSIQKVISPFDNL